MNTSVRNSEAYNDLLDVSAAWAALNLNLDANSAIQRIGQIISDAGLTDLVGVSLLHRHFTLMGTERLVHRASSAPELVSGPHKLCGFDTEENPLAPCRMKISTSVTGDASLVGVEFSDDPVVAQGYASLTGCHWVLEQVAQIIISAGLENLLGIAIWSSKEILAAENTDQVFLEETVEEIRHNRSRMIDRKMINEPGMMETSWGFQNSFEGARVFALCRSVCQVYAPGHVSEHRDCQYV